MPNTQQPTHDKSVTRAAEAILLGAPSFQEGLDKIRNQLLTASIREYFAALLAKHGLASKEAVQRANLDKDYGRQLLIGERMARRDIYIQLAIAMQLSIAETQSMLNFLGKGPLYAVRKRDAAILYALKCGYSLMDTQLLLDDNELSILGDAEDTDVQECTAASTPPPTRDIEQQIRQAQDFSEVGELVQSRFLQLSVSTYFSQLLKARNLTRKEVLRRAGLKESIGFQLLNGTRTAKNPDAYIRLALAMELSLTQTQQMLKFLKKGELYPLKERDAALLYCIGHHYSLDETQKLLRSYQLPEL